MNADPATGEFEYIVVGSGAGGGTLAARLAEAGRTVLLLEAGTDTKQPPDAGADGPGYDRLPADYDVPAFHPFASENEVMKWEFFVRHYDSDERQRLNPKHYDSWNGQPVDGILYPRAGTLGGCTAHNAMILTYPHNADWNGIAELTGDASWQARNMRRYFVRLEDCQYRPVYRFLAKFGIDPARHGWGGWLRTEVEIPFAVFEDENLIKLVLDYVRAASDESLFRRLRRLLRGCADPNDWRLVNRSSQGVFYTPLTTRDHGRQGTRERVLEVARKHPDRLRIELNALAARVLFDERTRATGVEYLSGERLYRAHARPGEKPGVLRKVRAAREVILCGGAFNTPQLLMLSGIGPRDELDRQGIAVRIDLPGVGRNLQDRYEVSVVNRMNFKTWKSLEGAEFAPGDPVHQEWVADRAGMYTTNGAGLAIIRRSTRSRPLPDLFCMPFLARFEGYYPGYSEAIAKSSNYLSWTILKAHTENRAGRVTLRSNDPRDKPQINFHYFEEGNDGDGEDLQSVVEGVKFARRLMTRMKKRKLIAEEEVPGEACQSDEELKEFVRRHAWGHHASCSCAIGPEENGGVLDGDFRVHGTTGLRVVDASVFPRIPGFFIVSAIYMVAEKAADVILADAKSAP